MTDAITFKRIRTSDADVIAKYCAIHFVLDGGTGLIGWGHRDTMIQ